MGILLCREVTSLGDSFGFDTQVIKAVGYRAPQATRKFLVEVSSTDTYTDTETVLAALPQKGELHPTIIGCVVDNVSCTVTSDVHIYEATVNYKWTESETDIDNDLNLPWKQPAAVSFSSDTSITQAMKLAYRLSGATFIVGLTPAVIMAMKEAEGTGTDMTMPTVPIDIMPLGEQPLDLPEEPVKSLAITLSACIKGEDKVNPKTHDITRVAGLLKLTHTVFGDIKDGNIGSTFIIRGWAISRYCGYISNVNVENLWYYSPVLKKNYAYFKITMTILDNSETWVRKVLNKSFNCFTVAGDPTSIAEIRVKDKKLNMLHRVDKPQHIDSKNGVCLTISTDGVPIAESISAPKEQVVLYHTKPLSVWEPLTTFLNDLIWEAPNVASATT